MEEIQKAEEEVEEGFEKKRRIGIFWKAFFTTIFVLVMLAVGFFGSWGLFPLLK